MELESIRNFVSLGAKLATAWQPTEAQLAAVRSHGFEVVVNLGTMDPRYCLLGEADIVAALGMAYHHIPVDFQNPTEQDFGQFCAVMEELKDAPVHVHCIANYRVSAFLYRYRRDVLGADEAQARAEMEDVWQPNGVWAKFVGR